MVTHGIQKYFPPLPNGHDVGQMSSPLRDDMKSKSNGDSTNTDLQRSTSEVLVESPETEISEYERKRLERMAMNTQFLTQLGMKATQTQMKTALIPSKQKVKISRRKISNEPRRQSKRLKEMSDSNKNEPIIMNEDLISTEEPVNKENMVFVESNVYKYSCNVSISSDVVAKYHPGSELKAFSRIKTIPVMTDPLLKKIYAMDFSPDGQFVAGGGHLGHVSLYTTTAPEHSLKDATQSPILSFKAHSGWISSLRLLQTISSPNPLPKNLLLTASNDSIIKLWDLDQSTTNDSNTMPKQVMNVENIHSNGIFSMDVWDQHVVTGSKDSTIAVSAFRSGESGSMEVINRYRDHVGVVKAVCFAPNQHGKIFSSGGNDRALRVFDTRIPSNATITIENAHTRAINSVVWHPLNDHLVLTSSFDPTLHLFDIRQSHSTPLYSFDINTQPSTTIHHPRFINKGKAVVVGGEMLSLFSTIDGSTISRGKMDKRADSIHIDPLQQRILVVSGAILQYYEWIA